MTTFCVKRWLVCNESGPCQHQQKSVSDRLARHKPVCGNYRESSTFLTGILLSQRPPFPAFRMNQDAAINHLLCRPYGGFNDTLCQIERCWQYALRWHRQLVIDTSRSGLRDDFANYFMLIPPHSAQLSLQPELLARLDRSSIVPQAISSRVSTYQERMLADATIVDDLTSAPITFDFMQQHPEECLVHHQGGGGNLSLDCLTRLRLQPGLGGEILSAIRSLGQDYDAVHIRNTDYSTEYESFFSEIRPKVAGRRLLVCSDDARCVSHAKAFFAESEIVTVGSIPDLGGAPLHAQTFDSPQRAFESNRKLLLDLFCLSQARNLFICRTRLGNISGFSVLAANLKARPDIVASVLGSPG